MVDLTPRQRQTVAAALTLVCAVAIIAVCYGFFWCLAAFLSTFSGVLLPLAVAGIAALVLKPYQEWLERRVNGRSVLAVGLVYLSVLLPVALFLWFFGSMLLAQLTGLLGQFPL